MNICIDGRTIYKRNTGFGYYAFYLIRHILRSECNDHITLILHKDVANLFFMPSCTKHHEILTAVDYRNRILRDAWENLVLPIIFKKHNINMFHSLTFHMPILRIGNIKQVVTIHDLVVFKMPEIYPKYYTIYWRFIIKRSLERSSKIIAISEATKQDIIDLFNIKEDKIHVIYHGIDLKRFRPKDETNGVGATLKKYGLKKPYIMALGLSDLRKNGERILKSYSKIIKDKTKDVSLAICGILRKRNRVLFDQIKEHGLSDRVVMTGFVEDEDLPILYRAADLFIFPSLYEGFGLPILEAMACGTPVITSNISSMPEVAGDAAVLVNPYDVDALARAMHGILTDKGLKESLVKKGLERVKQFSWEKCAEETIRVYEAACNSNKSSADYADFTD
ncbi:MAG: glycosyltransferase family 4 protein [Deltaproteobacteria bacterium]|nr:glycosyltransferase family 4 protein [Deltaproteobacteria bacterium]